MDRQNILEAAAQVFSQKGYHGASMQDIAQVVQLQKPSLYHHVASKQDILLALLEQGLDMLTERLLPILTSPQTPEDRLHAAMNAYLQTMAEHRDLASVLLLEHRSLNPVQRERHIARRDQFECLWRNLIDEGIQAGRYSIPNSGMAVKALLGVMNWAITWYNPDGPMTAEQIADFFADLFLTGMLVRPNSHEGPD